MPDQSCHIKVALFFVHKSMRGANNPNLPNVPYSVRERFLQTTKLKCPCANHSGVPQCLSPNVNPKVTPMSSPPLILEKSCQPQSQPQSQCSPIPSGGQVRMAVGDDFGVDIGDDFGVYFGMTLGCKMSGVPLRDDFGVQDECVETLLKVGCNKCLISFDVTDRGKKTAGLEENGMSQWLIKVCHRLAKVPGTPHPLF